MSHLAKLSEAFVTKGLKPIRIKSIDENLENEDLIEIAYLRYLADTYLDDPAIDAENRTLMGFAAYNAGPYNLQKFRAFAQQAGLDPNIWFSNVELGAAKIVGFETAQYVNNIFKYYIAYQLSVERLEAQRKE